MYIRATIIGLTPKWVRKGITRILCNEFTGAIIERIYHNQIPFYGYRLNTDDPQVVRGIKAAIFFRLYEAAEASVTRKKLRGDLDLVELGASIGGITTIALNKLNADRKAVIVEASPSLIRLLRENVRNTSRKNTIIVNAALSYHPSPDGTVRFAAASYNLAGRIIYDHAENAVAVRAVTLSELISKYDIGDYVLLIDIEGAEAEILLEDTAALKRCKQIIVEGDDFHCPFSITIDRMKSAGFKITDRNRGVYCLER
jgi:FkbM family methyltransferase